MMNQPLVLALNLTHQYSISSSQSEQVEEDEQHVHPKDEWLPITESRNGNAYFAAFHILNSNIGFQALMLPVAFATLGW
jgi:hypothetical protein